MKKIIVFLFFVLSLQFVFPMSYMYVDPLEPYDSEMRLRYYGSDGSAYTHIDGYGDFSDKIPENVYIHIAGAGKAIYEHYGHVGIILEYDDGKKILCDYGLFDSSDKGFVKNFIKGNMYYNFSVHGLTSWINHLETDKRSYRIYKLNLSKDQKRNIQNFIAYSSDENSIYLYDFFKDNCSTRVRDLLNRVYDGDFSAFFKDIKMGTWRTAIEYVERNYPFYEAFYNIGFGCAQDKSISYYDAMFLPEYFEEGMKDFYVYKLKKRKPLINDEIFAFIPVTFIQDLDSENLFTLSFKELIEKYDIIKEYKVELVEQNEYEPLYPTTVKKGYFPSPNYRRYMIVASIFLLINLIFIPFLKKYKKLLVFPLLISFLIDMIFAIMGTAFIIMSLFTIHHYMWFNYNLIFINPYLFYLGYRTIKYIRNINDRTEEKFFILFHKIYILLITIAFLGKIFYIQKNLYLIIIFFVYYVSVLAFGIYSSGDKLLCKGWIKVER